MSLENHNKNNFWLIFHFLTFLADYYSGRNCQYYFDKDQRFGLYARKLFTWKWTEKKRNEKYLRILFKCNTPCNFWTAIRSEVIYWLLRIIMLRFFHDSWMIVRLLYSGNYLHFFVFFVSIFAQDFLLNSIAFHTCLLVYRFWIKSHLYIRYDRISNWWLEIIKFISISIYCFFFFFFLFVL